MLTYYQQQPGQAGLARVEPVDHQVWIHGTPSAAHQLEWARYGVDMGAMNDVRDPYELPRLERHDGVLYVFLRAAAGATTSARTVPVLAVVHPDRFMTLTSNTGVSPLRIAERGPLDTGRPMALLVALCAALVADYEARVATIIDKIAVARRRLNRQEVTNQDFIGFVAIEDSLNEYQGSLDGLGGVCRRLLRAHQDALTGDDSEALEDVALHIDQLLVSMRSSAQTIASIQSAYSTVANNVLNQRMKILTAITILLAIPNVLYGMYGMNVALPWQHQPWIYGVIVGCSLATIGLVAWLARRYRVF